MDAASDPATTPAARAPSMEVQATSATTGEWVAAVRLPKSALARDLHDALQRAQPKFKQELCCYHAVVAGQLLSENTRLAAVGVRHGCTIEVLRCRQSAILLTAEDGSIKVFNADTSLCVAEYSQLPGRRPYRKIDEGCFSSNGRRFLSYSKDRSVVHLQRYDDAVDAGHAQDRPPSIRLTGHRGKVHAAAFSHQGFHVATASADGTAALWNARTGECLRRFEGHENEVQTVAFSSFPTTFQLSTEVEDVDGEAHATPDPPVRLITSSSDQTAKIWLTATGACIGTFKHPCGVTSAYLSPNGHWALTAAEDRCARLFSVRSSRLLRRFELADQPVLQAIFCQAWTSPALEKVDQDQDQDQAQVQSLKQPDQAQTKG